MAETKTSENFVAITPEMKAELQSMQLQISSLEGRKQALIVGFLLAHSINVGDWEIMPDGSGFLRKEEQV